MYAGKDFFLIFYLLCRNVVQNNENGNEDDIKIVKMFTKQPKNGKVINKLYIFVH